MKKTLLAAFLMMLPGVAESWTGVVEKARFVDGELALPTTTISTTFTARSS